MGVLIWMLLPFSLPVQAPDRNDATAVAEDLGRLLGHYDQEGGGETIPIEKAFLKLKGLRAGDKLVRFLEHGRFGATAAWAISEIGDPTGEASILKAFASRTPIQQAEVSRYVAGFRTQTALAWIRERAGDPPNPAFVPALLRAGDSAVLANLRKDLTSEDMVDLTSALRLVGEGQNPDLLGALVGLIDDSRPLSSPVRSKLVRGDRAPEWKTVGELALEAASEVVAPNTPAYIAWWYEIEDIPRFGPGKEGRALFTQYLEAAKNSRAAGAVDAERAVQALLAHVRSEQTKRFRVKISSIRFDRDWTISYVAGDKRLSVTVSKEGKVLP